MADNDLFERLKLQALAKKQEREKAQAAESMEQSGHEPSGMPEPELIQEQEPAPEPESVKPQIRITVSSDRLRAELELVSPPDAEKVTDFPSRKELEDAVAAEKIVHGIKETVYDKILSERVTDKPYLIAQGFAPTRGIDGRIEYLIDTNRSLTPKILEDGTVDFKQIGYALVVEARQHLCRIIPPQPGTDGMDIFGSVLEHTPGESPIPPTGRNTEVSDDGAFVIAACSGNLSVVKGFLNIDEKLAINGNVDNSTGSINFPGTVTIYGDVLEGFQVISGADVIIRGFVEGAVIQAGGGITLNGINGMGKGVLSAEGDIKCSYVESATIICGGDLAADTILNSNVKCKGNLLLSGRKGALIGGQCTVYGNITAKNIGTLTHIPTLVILGSECDNIRLLSEYQHKFEEVKQQLLEMDQSITYLAALVNARKIKDSKVQKLHSMIEERKDLSARYDELSENVEKLSRMLSDCRESGDCERSILECSGTMHTGVRLQMSRSSMDVVSSYNNFRAYLEEGEIKISM